MNTRNTFMIAAIAVSLGALNADASDTVIPFKMPEFQIPGVKNFPPKLKPEKLPSPGIYRSSPYISIVIVPESVDPAFEHNLGAGMRMDDNVKSPDSNLEPYQFAR